VVAKAETVLAEVKSAVPSPLAPAVDAVAAAVEKVETAVAALVPVEAAAPADG
jgi:hypothetical protein